MSRGLLRAKGWRTGAGAREGTTLFEVLVCTAIFMIVVNVLMSIFDSGTRLSALALERVDRMDGALGIQEGFTAAVREAVCVAEGVGEHRSGAETLVLRLADVGDEERYAVLGRLSEGEGLCRMDVAVDDGGMEAVSFVRYPLGLTSYSFLYEGGAPAEARLVSLDYVVKRAPDEGGRPLRHVIAAALRCGGMAEAKEGGGL